ncbi:hypothetical protein KA005_63900 [bacterium]|jgi:hypothetical protein|nr:hypothetical protein [bacterium]
MSAIDIIPIEQHPMSIYTAIVLFFGWVGWMVVGRWIIDRADKHDKRIATLETNSVETNTIMKRIDKNMDTVLSKAQETNADVIQYILNKDPK